MPEAALRQCGSLAQVELPDGLIAIWSSAFESTALTEVRLPDGLTTLGDRCFQQTKLTAVEVPASVTSLGVLPFGQCASLESITLLCENSAAAGALTDNANTLCYAVRQSGTTVALGNATGDFRYTDLADRDYVYRQLSATGNANLGYDGSAALMLAAYNGKSATTISVTDGVSIVGAKAFYNHTEVTELTLPTTLRYIDSEAFSHLEGITRVDVPEGVIRIGVRAFEYCLKLTDVKLPDSLKVLGDYTFTNCLQVRDIELPDDMTSVGVNVLGEQDVAGNRTFKVNITSHTAHLLGSYQFFYDKQNPDYRYRWISTGYSDYNSGNWIETSGLFLNKYLGSEAEITLNNLVVGIESRAFCMMNADGSVASYNTTLEKITFPTNVKYIGSFAFENASKLREVVFESALNSIDYAAFQSCRALESVTFGGTVGSIGGYAFSGCGALKTLAFNGGVNSFENFAFSECGSLESVNIPAGSITIGGYAFNRCDKLQQVTIPDSVTSIGEYAFHDSPVAEVKLKDTGVGFGQRAFSWPTKVYCGLESDTAHRLSDAYTLFVPDNLDATHAMLKDNALRYVRVNETGTETLRFYYYFGNEPFIQLYDKIASLAGRMIADDPYYIQWDSTQYGNPNYSADAFDQEVARLHTGGARILANLGSDQANMISECGYGFAPDESSDFDYCYHDGELYIFESFCAEKIANGSYTGEKKQLADGSTVAVLTGDAIPEGVKGIHEYAFGVANSGVGTPESLGASGYASGDIASYLRSASWLEPEGALFICMPKSDLAKMTGAARYVFVSPDDHDLRMLSLADGAVCRMLNYLADTTELKIPEGVTELVPYCFIEGNTQFDPLADPNITIMGKNTTLVSVEIPDSLNYLSDYAFANCTALKELSLPGSVTEVGAHAFQFCTGLETVMMEPDNCAIDDYAFYGCTALKDVVMDLSTPYGNTLSLIGAHAFEGCTALETENITKGYVVIGDFAFSDCSSLKEADLSEIRSLGKGAFQNCAALTSVTLSGSLKKLHYTDTVDSSMYIDSSDAPFYGCTALAEVHVGEGITELGDCALWTQGNDGNMAYSVTTHFYLPASLTAISDTAIDTTTYYGHEMHDANGNYIGSEDICASAVHAEVNSFAAKWASEKLGKFIPEPDEGWDYKWQDEKVYIAGHHGETNYVYSLPTGTEGVLPGVSLDDLKFIDPDVNGTLAHSVDAFYTAEDSDLRLSWDGGALTLRRYDGSAASVTVPNGVTRIGSYAFAKSSADPMMPSSAENTTLTSVTLPKGLTEIGEGAFYNCTALKTPVIPETVERIGNQAFFMYMTSGSLGDLALPDGMKVLGSNVVNGGKLVLPDDMTEVGSQSCQLYANIGSATSKVLADRTEFTDIADGNGYTYTEGKFYLSAYNHQGADFVMSDEAVGLYQNGSYACVINGMSSTGLSLASITLPEGCVEFKRYDDGMGLQNAFIDGVSTLTTLSFPEGVTSLPAYIARNNEHLSYLVLPRSLTSIDPQAFDDSATTVFGHGGSYAETYADDKGLTFIDLDDPDSLAKNAVITAKTDRLYTGDVVDVRDLVSVTPEIGEPLPLEVEVSASSASLLSVDGTQVTALKYGDDAVLYVKVTGSDSYKDIPIKIYDSIEDFELPEYVFVDLNSSPSGCITTLSVTPATGTDGMFTVDCGPDSGSMTLDLYMGSWSFPVSTQGVRECTVTSSSGITKTFTLVAYKKVNSIELSADKTQIDIGEALPVTTTVKLDGKVYVNPMNLYSLSSNNTGRAIVSGESDRLSSYTPTGECQVIGMGEGKAKITATVYNNNGTAASSSTLTIEVSGNAGMTLKLPASTTTIDAGAFEGTAATRVVIPVNGGQVENPETGIWDIITTTIGSRAFANSSIKVVEFLNVPEASLGIAEDAFEGCADVVFITPYYSGTISDYAKRHGFTCVSKSGN